MKTILMLILATLPSVEVPKITPENINKYFYEIALNREFSPERDNHMIKRWEGNIKVYCQGTWSKALKLELKKIIKDLKPLIGKRTIFLVKDKKLSNFIIYLGHGDNYVNLIKPMATKRIAENYGIFRASVYSNGVISKATMNVDIHRAKDLALQKHLLREEFTQALGLMNDSTMFPDSIFYSEFSKTTKYSTIDKILIRRLYSDKLKPGMKKKQVMKALK